MSLKSRGEAVSQNRFFVNQIHSRAATKKELNYSETLLWEDVFNQINAEIALIIIVPLEEQIIYHFFVFQRKGFLTCLTSEQEDSQL